MKYDDDSGYWVDDHGNRHVKNEFDPTDPTFIEVTPDGWSGWRLNKKHRLTWPNGIHPSLKTAFEEVLKYRLRQASPSSLSMTKTTIQAIVSNSPSGLPLTPSDLLDLETVRHVWA